jgi:hypothetical protein
MRGNIKMGDLRITGVTKPTSKQWEQLENNCEYATFYQTRVWNEILCSNPNPHYNNRIPQDASQLICFSDGAELLLPLVRYNKFKGIFKLYSVPADFTYGGFLSESNITPEHERILFNYLNKYNLRWRQNPSRPVTIHPGFHRTEDFIMILDMRGGMEAIRKKWKTIDTRFPRFARQALERGVQVYKSEKLEDWKEFYQVYLETMSRKAGAFIYSWSVFEGLYHQAAGKAQLWVARVDGKLIAGGLRFCHNRSVFAWVKGGLKEYFHLKAPKYLDFCQIEYYAQNGYWWFDFGECGGDAGIMTYKSEAGGEQMEGSVLTHSTPSFRTYERVRWEAMNKIKSAKGLVNKYNLPKIKDLLKSS